MKKDAKKLSQISLLCGLMYVAYEKSTEFRNNQLWTLAVSGAPTWVVGFCVGAAKNTA